MKTITIKAIKVAKETAATGRSAQEVIRDAYETETGGKMTIIDALSNFGKLSIGDGLVSAVPSLLISVATGIIVTRSENNKSFGLEIKADGLRNPNLFKIIGILLILLGIAIIIRLR